jgi:hypothetical protein
VRMDPSVISHAMPIGTGGRDASGMTRRAAHALEFCIPASGSAE